MPRASVSICRTRSRVRPRLSPISFKVLRIVSVQPEPHAQHGRFPHVHGFQLPHDVDQVVAFDHLRVGGACPLVLDHLAQRPAGVGLVGLRREVVDADGLLDDRQLLAGQAQHAGDLFGRGRAAQFLGQAGRRPPPLREQLDHVGRNADGLGRVDQGPLDRLLDPIAGIGREARAHGRVEALHGAEQTQVSLFDQVLQAESLAGVAAGDVDHQPQVGADHAIAGLHVAAADGHGQFVLVVGREQGGLIDLPQVGFQGRLHGGEWAAAGLGHGGSLFKGAIAGQKRHRRCPRGFSKEA